ncbi:MAG TPA: hypothetical protein VLX92_29640 [Kofleriaceae bacterium]|nr:hypothetical protein [Kofleriaceae bacterium]
MRLLGLLAFASVVTLSNLAGAQPAPPPVWDSSGWVLLGETTVHGHGRMERDAVPVGRQEGRFSRLTIVVENSDLELVDFAVQFERGAPWRPGITHFFREGQRTRVIEFPESAWGHEARSIRQIDFAYRNVPGEGHAHVQVWGWRAGAEAPPPPPAWDSTGWTKLGEREVHGHGKMERDTIPVGRYEGKFRRLTLLVENSDLELVDMTIRLGHGNVFRPGVTHFFRDGQRTRLIELPDSAWGDGSRHIEGIDFTYRNVPGEGHAHVVVFGQ